MLFRKALLCFIALMIMAHLSVADEPRQEATTGSLGGGLVLGDNSNGTSAMLGKGEVNLSTIGKNPEKKFAFVGDGNLALMIGSAKSIKNGNEVGGGLSGLIHFDALYAPFSSTCSLAGGGGIDYGGTLIGPLSNASNNNPVYTDIGTVVRASAGLVCAGKSGRAFSLLVTGGVGGGNDGNRYLLGLRTKFIIHKTLSASSDLNLIRSTRPDGTEVIKHELATGLQIMDPETHRFMGFDAKVSDDQIKYFTLGKTDNSLATVISVVGGVSF
jgi:hypothetical protein